MMPRPIRPPQLSQSFFLNPIVEIHARQSGVGPEEVARSEVRKSPITGKHYSLEYFFLIF